MKRKAKIEELIKIREKAIEEEKKGIRKTIHEIEKLIIENTCLFVLEIYQELSNQALNPYKSELTETIKISKYEEEIKLVMKEIVLEAFGKTDDNYINTSILLISKSINTENIYVVSYKDEKYLININEFKNLLEEYGINYKTNNDEQNNLIFLITVNLEKHTLTKLNKNYLQINSYLIN